MYFVDSCLLSSEVSTLGDFGCVKLLDYCIPLERAAVKIEWSVNNSKYIKWLTVHITSFVGLLNEFCRVYDDQVFLLN